MPTLAADRVSERVTGSEPKWLTVARLELGVHRAPDHRESRIVHYFDATSLHPSEDTTPWCAAFTNWCLQQAGVVGTRSASALSFLDWGVAAECCVGAIAVMPRGGPGSGLGHVGIVERFDDTGVWLLAGNQGGGDNGYSKVCIRRYSRRTFTAFRWPKGAQHSTSVIAGAVGTAATAVKTSVDAVNTPSDVQSTVKDMVIEHGPDVAGKVAANILEHNAERGTENVVIPAVRHHVGERFHGHPILTGVSVGLTVLIFCTFAYLVYARLFRNQPSIIAPGPAKPPGSV